MISISIGDSKCQNFIVQQRPINFLFFHLESRLVITNEIWKFASINMFIGDSESHNLLCNKRQLIFSSLFFPTYNLGKWQSMRDEKSTSD